MAEILDRHHVGSQVQDGDTVFVKAARNLNIPGGAYVVTARLPERTGGFEYCVRSGGEPHERVMS
jgi:hypothetical protein